MLFVLIKNSEGNARLKVTQKLILHAVKSIQNFKKSKISCTWSKTLALSICGAKHTKLRK